MIGKKKKAYSIYFQLLDVCANCIKRRTGKKISIPPTLFATFESLKNVDIAIEKGTWATLISKIHMINSILLYRVSGYGKMVSLSNNTKPSTTDCIRANII